MTEENNQGVAGTQMGETGQSNVGSLENGPKSVDTTMAVFGEVTGTYGSGEKSIHDVLLNTFWGNGGVIESPCGIDNRGLHQRQLTEASFQEYLNHQMGVKGGMEQTESPVVLTEKMGEKAQTATPPQEQKKVGFLGRLFGRGK